MTRNGAPLSDVGVSREAKLVVHRRPWDLTDHEIYRHPENLQFMNQEKTQMRIELTAKPREGASYPNLKMDLKFEACTATIREEAYDDNEEEFHFKMERGSIAFSNGPVPLNHLVTFEHRGRGRTPPLFSITFFEDQYLELDLSTLNFLGSDLPERITIRIDLDSGMATFRYNGRRITVGIDHFLLFI